MPKLRVIIKPPPEPTGDPAQDVVAQRDYLLQMSEELAYVLTHLEADNINDSTFERIQSMIPRPYTGLPVMDGDANPGQSEQWARGNHRHPHDTSKADVTALEETAGDLADHVADTGNPHEVTAAQVGLGNVDNVRQYSASNPPPIPTPGEVGAIPTTDKGTAGGVAELDSNGMVPSAQLPSYVDDVLEYASYSAFPATGESGKIYVALDTNLTYRWSGSAYVEISQSLALGETSSTAYRGDRGKTAYDHSQVTSGNPHNVTAAEVGLGNVANERQYSALNPPPLPTPADIGAATAQDLSDHVGDTANPHSVTAAQVGLGNVADERQYSASNPPPYPVTSVNGSTGTVTLDASDVGARPDTWTPSAADVGARPDDWVPDAEDVPYDNTGSGLTATDLQAAVDELAGGGGGGGPSPSDNNPAMAGTAAPGTSALYSRGDHVHPHDTSKQDTLTFDNLPQQWSGNPVKSSGIYSSLARKADQEQLAPREIGTVTSQNYERGEYFYWVPMDMLLRVTTAIAAGTTIDVGTNCEEAQFGRELNKRPEYGMLAPVESSGTASRAYTYGERFIYQGTLYQAISQIAVNGAITPGTNCQTVSSMEARWQTYSYSANGTYTITLQRNSRRYLVLADRLGRAAVLMAYIAYNGNTPQLITLADIDAANRGIALSISGATLTVTVSQTYAIVKIMEV